MHRQTLLTLLTAAMLVLAGCAGSTGGDGSPSVDETDTPGDEVAQTGDTGSTGTVEFYVSDDPGQIDDFRHLNVTISQIGFKQSGDADDEAENETETPENETADETTTDNTTTADGGLATDSQSDTHESENETAGQEGDDDKKGGDDWITRDVDSRSVDLTQLRGDNATLLDSPELPAGNYSTVFVYISDINATLADGSSTNVKLPSNKLQLNKGFTLEPNGTVSFVYDITVFRAGNSGKYILKPVISQSGPDQTVRNVDDGEDGDGADRSRGNSEDGGPPEARGQN
ncbi:DUF4382 domain-containing protein [Salinibaculum rarum]|uniref:DUF4382 domain-containing protein n=1 Tax=Salinibaculum rarum TaxID=3058903 RepID=UPI00265D9B72|nr:DUF4382 domain-containing protein [Salinibaculum sp. KK48]